MRNFFILLCIVGGMAFGSAQNSIGLAFKTNVLSDILGVANIGIEKSVYKKFSVQVSGFDGENKFLTVVRYLGYNATLRYYLVSKQKLSGLALGLGYGKILNKDNALEEFNMLSGLRMDLSYQLILKGFLVEFGIGAIRGNKTEVLTNINGLPNEIIKSKATEPRLHFNLGYRF